MQEINTYRGLLALFFQGMVGEALDLQVLSCSQEAFQSVLVHLNLGTTGLNNDQSTSL